MFNKILYPTDFSGVAEKEDVDAIVVGSHGKSNVA
jgi:hypothetical protein